MIIERRAFMAGLGALFAAPAIVKASSLMVCAPTETLVLPNRNAYLTIDAITRESVRLFLNSNTFLKNLERQYEQEIHSRFDEAKVGDALRIRLPTEFTVSDGLSLSAQSPASEYVSFVKALEPPQTLPELSVTEAAAIGAAAVLAKNPAVSRRFWAK